MSQYFIEFILIISICSLVNCSSGNSGDDVVHPWSVHRFDPKNTGRCSFAGPDKLNVFLRKQLKFEQDLFIWPSSSPVTDGECLYFMGRTNDSFNSRGIFAMNHSGDIEWYNPNSPDIPLSQISDAVPAIDQIGNIYVVTLFPEGFPESKGLTCVDSKGNILWVNQEELVYCNGGLNFSNDYSVVYIPDTPPPGPLTAFETEHGDYLWKSNARWTTYSTPAIDENGIIYYGDSYAYFYALNPDGSKKWEVNLSTYAESIDAPPTIGNEGNLYVHGEWGDYNGPLIAISATGEVLWVKEFERYYGPGSAPAVDSKGRVILGHNGFIYSFNIDGSTYWSRTLLKNSFVNVNVIIDNTGNIYAYIGSLIWILDEETGDIKDKYKLPDEEASTSHIVISSDRKLYYINNAGYFYVFGDESHLPALHFYGIITLLVALSLILKIRRRHLHCQ